ncbi:MAG: hypothetical protein R3E68_15055 [Burkholderiaceae bacterium]
MAATASTSSSGTCSIARPAARAPDNLASAYLRNLEIEEAVYQSQAAASAQTVTV